MPKLWNWRGYQICYQHQGTEGPAVVFIHGFGASWGHWRKNLPVLGETCRCYALDLIGFGGSQKPQPLVEIDYTFETWGQQVADFCREVVGEPVLLVGNSIGCIVAMQAAVDNPDWVRGLCLINCSLRLLHERRRAELPWFQRWGAPGLQRLLKIKPFGHFFFSRLARPEVVRKVLLQAYRRPEAVSEELVEMLLKPAGELGAADVFIAFTCYSQGPLPEDLLPLLPCRALLLWGTEDPWEPVSRGRELAKWSTVEQFIELEGLGHCPQDEAPEVVNPILQDWSARS
jgi:pimeloyl-ACP methyl ester carboxylesterase